MAGEEEMAMAYETTNSCISLAMEYRDHVLSSEE